MNNAERYFTKQKENLEFVESYNQISEQIDIEWELEKVKKHIEKDESKNIILREIEKLQKFIHNARFIAHTKAV